MEKNYFIQHKMKYTKWLCAALLFFMIGHSAFAQLSGYKYRDGIKVQENAGVQKLNYQVLLNINTVVLVGANKMNIKGNDIRFSKDCGGSVLLNYFIDSTTMNTANTQIWVELDTLKASGMYYMYMWYGNATATAASNFNNTFPLTTQLIVPSGTVTLTGTNNYSWFEIAAGAAVVVTPNAPLVINARKIKITGNINGNGSGYLGGQQSLNGNGPGPGLAGSVLTPANTSGGGGAYGGNGGRGNVAAITNGEGGIAYGNTTTIDMGSGGGGPVGVGAGAGDGNGGGGVTLNAREIEITGAINLNGNPGTSGTNVGWSGGGGAGGGLLLKGYNTILTGTITANGAVGGGGNAGGGGGGGGRINLFSEIAFTPGTYSVAAGLQGVTTNTNNPAAAPGSPGVISTGTFVAGEPTYTVLPHVVLTSSNTTICQGATASFTATTGFNPYNFFVNASSVQNSAANSFSSTTINNNDKIKVLASDANGCPDTSNVITFTVNPLPIITVSPTATAICAGGSTNLTASGGTTYSWAPPTGLSSTTGSMVTASPANTTTYIVTGTDNNNCSNSAMTTLTVNPAPAITMTPTSTLICVGLSASLSANASGAVTYNWAPSATLSSATGPSVTATPTVTTTYTVLVTDGNGCMNANMVTVTVSGCTSVQQTNSSSQFNAYPNPTNGSFTIETYFMAKKNVTIELKNMLGETVKVVENSEVSGQYVKEVNTNDLMAGIYFLVMKTGNESQVKKMIKN